MSAERAGASGAASHDAGSVLPEGGSLALHRVGRWIGATVVRLPFRVRIHHRERVPSSGPLVLVANHSSLMEGPLLFGMLPHSAVFLIKHELFRGPLGWFLRKIGQLPVRRGEPDRRPLLAAVRVLRAGGLVAVFPEGTRGTGDVKTAQDGAAWLARTSGARVLPVVCRGTYRPPGSRRRFLPRVDVLFGEPVTLTGAKGRTGLSEATEQIRDELVALVAELDRTVGGGRDDKARGKQA
ncbi:1-acyl-sn-glycerol-3-phosphate acyltransferase [Allosaccharopolyspora coralli]|uniref:1-acyl-sn-glycerol-3-phosphate acyltransferase n=1 Tax=Allosaccharopolyspora coralli TaxID=2665642 RepID=A0A5Q3Q9N7_9PSEU|nr:lysophospholipid acyltransferase family protein [Allosaccharopolyspora coralli]QGK70570.1 1-acyl-sn-glycerol-3-phosphate acyltransferase [Allosaccharopolyspora coralli]